MMVNFPICLKVTLVNSGCNNRFICYFDGSDRFSGLAKWFLDSDVIFGAVGLGSEQKDISPKSYDCMFHTIFFQHLIILIRSAIYPLAIAPTSMEAFGSKSWTVLSDTLIFL